MEFGFTEEQEVFRQDVRSFCQNEPVGELSKEFPSRYSPSFYRKVAEKGWLGLTFPKEYGGQGKSHIYEAIFSEEVGYNFAPIGGPYRNTVIQLGNLILKFGSEQQKKEFLPRIIKGEITTGQAFTEPEAGSDLASVQTRAVRKGDSYIINGQKMFWTYGHIKIYAILMARTDPDAPLEKGISLFILDNNTPGISCSPLMTMGGGRTNQVYLDNVKIPAENLIGEENKGWDYFTQTKDYYWYRGQNIEVGSYQRLLDNMVQYIRETQSEGHLLSQNPTVRQKIAEMATDMKALRLLNYRLMWVMDQGLDALPLAAILKVFSDEALRRFDNKAMQILGIYGQLQGGSKYAPLGGIQGMMYQIDAMRHFLDSGGAITARNFIAINGLGLPEYSLGGM